jgi:hypothetical protein
VAFDENTATAIDDTDITDLPDGSLVATIDDSGLSNGVTYNLVIIATPADGSDDVTFGPFPFGLGLAENAVLNIDEELLGDTSEGEDGVPLNRVVGGNGVTSIDFEPGAVLPSPGTLPSCELSQEDADNVGGNTDDIVGEATTVTLTDVEFTANPIPFNLPFDATTVEDINELALYVYDSGTNEWEALTDEISVDPVNGTVSGFINFGDVVASQLNISSKSGMKTTSVKGQMSALRTATGYRNNPRALASGSVTFAVGISTSGGVAPTDGAYHQYNFPNPFNLETKTVTRRDSTQTIRGTYIVLAPTGTLDTLVSVKVRIYNVAGDLVREFDTTSTAGRYNYIEWDGKNTAGDDVASGVYFAAVDAPGAPKKEPIKMVLVK